MNLPRYIQLIQFLEAIRSSYLLIPALILCGSAILAVTLIQIDVREGTDAWQAMWWIFNGGAEGARSLLSTVAGSAITVAGTVFSITVAILSLTSSQFGPRLLRGFLRDTGNQVVLGIFLGTFLYCLVVLRTVRSIEESYFVPHIAVTGGVGLALTSVFMLVYYIHHITRSIQAEQIVASVAEELAQAIDTLYPEKIGVPPSESDHAEAPQAIESAADGHPVTGENEGYLTAIDADILLDTAVQYDLTITLHCRPGDFITPQRILAKLAPATHATRKAERQLCKAFSFGPHRTATQDATYGLQQLTEVAVRSLSPGINDPFTAIHCIDWLGANLCRMAGRKFPSPLRYDSHGALRVIARTTDYAEMMEVAFGEIRLYGKSDGLVMLRLMATMGAIARHVSTPEQYKTLLQQARLLLQAGKSGLDNATYEQLQRQFDALPEFMPSGGTGNGF